MMALFEFSVIEKDNYGRRLSKFIRSHVLFSLFFFVLALLITQTWTMALGVAVFMFFVQFFKSVGHGNYFINEIKMDDEKIDIWYTHRSEDKQISGSYADFNFKKKTTFLDRSKVAYLSISYKGTIVIKQFIQYEWTEPVFDKVVLIAKSRTPPVS